MPDYFIIEQVCSQSGTGGAGAVPKGPSLGALEGLKYAGDRNARKDEDTKKKEMRV